MRTLILSSIILAASLPLPTWAQTHVYDPAGRLRWSTQPSGASTSYVYDDAGNITAVVSVSAGQDFDGDSLPDSFEIQFSGGLSISSLDPSSDTDGDGVINLGEYAFSRDPNKAETGNAALTPVSIETTPGPVSYLTLTFLRPKQATNLLNYIVEVSTTLMPLEWSSDSAYVEVVSVTDQGGGIEMVKARSKIVMEPVVRQFLRVRAVPVTP